jgi:DNA-binding transcriptional MerR regulator
MTNIYLLKDLARLSGQSIYTVKYYLKLGLLKESGRSPETNFRYFNDNTVAQLYKIREFKKQGLSLLEIKNKIAHELF